VEGIHIHFELNGSKSHMPQAHAFKTGQGITFFDLDPFFLFFVPQFVEDAARNPFAYLQSDQTTVPVSRAEGAAAVDLTTLTLFRSVRFILPLSLFPDAALHYLEWLQLSTGKDALE